MRTRHIVSVTIIAAVAGLLIARAADAHRNAERYRLVQSPLALYLKKSPSGRQRYGVDVYIRINRTVPRSEDGRGRPLLGMTFGDGGPGATPGTMDVYSLGRHSAHCYGGDVDPRPSGGIAPGKVHTLKVFAAGHTGPVLVARVPIQAYRGHESDEDAAAARLGCGPAN